MAASVPGDYRPAPRAFAGRTVLVTGAGDGLGRSVALEAARYGAEVILLGRTVRKLESIHDRIVEAGGPPPALYPMDLCGANPDDYADMAGRIDEAYGRLHGIVHGAAAFRGLAPLAHIEPEDWVRTVHVNLSAPFLITRACLPLLQRVPDAAVVFVGDASGQRARAYWGAYAVSKCGVEGLAGVLAEEVESAGTPRVACVHPGPMRTGLRRRAFPAEAPDVSAEPDAVAGGVLFALDPAAPIVHGASVDIE
ncbi:MAG: SDR family NAD(P)-dependent oxidoreductase [Thiotrichales bacterium]|nr:SDR family NAD(P)-dependent oxidoreductase [Thiotrichales bacterium]